MRAVAKISLVLALLVPLSSFAALTGTVITTDGTPVSGAKITAYALEASDAHIKRLLSKNPERPALSTAQSDSKGTFSIDPQKETIVDLRVDASGFAPEGLRLGVDEEIGTIALDPAETKKGRITANGKPVAGAQVVVSALGGSLEFGTVTGADGAYSVPDPNVWAGRLVVMHPDYATLDQTATGRLAAKIKLDQTLTAGKALTGRVLSGDGQTPVAKASITIDDWPVAQSGEDGSFSIPHTGANWTLLRAAGDDRVAAHARDKNASLTLKLAKGAYIRGTVKDAKTQRGIAGVEVRTNPMMSTITDAKGNYALGPLPAGHYELTAIRPQFGITNTAVVVTSGQAMVKVLYLTMRARAVGSVVDEAKHPVAGARVSTQPAGRGRMNFVRFNIQQQLQSRFTGPDGRFVIRGIEPDADIQVDAIKKGYPAGKSEPMRLASGERKAGILITIPQGVALSGRVTDKNGKPLSAVAVSPSLAEGRGPMGMRRMVRNVIGGRSREGDQVRTASDGTFTVRLKEGTYDLGFIREGFAAKDVHAVTVTRTTKPLEVTLEPGVAVAGRVTRGGSGVEGADVMVMGESGFQSATTGSDGSFRIEDLTPGPSMINVTKRDDFIQRVQPVTIPNENLVIDLPAGGRISGRVVSKDDKQPITQFEAGITNTRSGGGMSMMMPAQTKSFSSDDGTFVLENVPPGPVTVVANSPGYASGRVTGLNLEEGKALTDVEIALESGVHLTGKVTGPDGSPVSGAYVRLDTGSPSGGRVMRVASGPDGTTTDPNGEYSLDSLESGEKTFSFSKEGYVSASKTATLSGKEARLDAQLGAGMQVRGTVVTSGGAPVGEASVRAMSAAEGGFGRSTLADASGNFEFDGLAPGHYSFVASKIGLMDARLNDVDIATAGSVRLELKAGGTIYGQVTGLSADALQQVTVTANGSGAGSNTSVDSTGNFRIEGAPIGTVRVSAQYGRGFAGDSRSTPVKSVEVSAGGSAQVDLEFSSNITVGGRVTRSGQPLASVMVGFFPKAGGTRVQTTTDSNGAYTASGFEPGTYTVQVFDLQRMSPYTTSLDVKSSTTFDVDMRVATVRGRVIDAETGDAISEAQVNVRASDGTGGMLSSRGAPTDPNGSFTIENVSSGSYQVTAVKDGYGNQSTDLVVGDSAPDDLTIRLSKSGGTLLHIIDARDRRPLDASTRVLDTQGRAVSQDLMRFDSTGGTIKLNLNPGRYQATIFAQGYAPQTFDIMVPGDQTLALTPGGSIQIRSRSDKAAWARLIQNGHVYIRGPYQTDGSFRVDPKPGITQVVNVASGSFTLQLLDANGNAIASVPVTVIEGQTVTVDL